MIIENGKSELAIKIDNKEYVISNNDDYQKFILIITDPKSKLVPNIEIDESVSEENKVIAENYKKFINDFLENKNDLLKENGLSPNDTEGENSIDSKIDSETNLKD